MHEFMDYVRSAFYDATDWNRESSYSSLNSTANALLNFPTPIGVRLTLSSLASPNFATSYQLGSIGVVDGSISYLYSSVPLDVHLTPQSDRTPLATLFQSYRPLPALPRRGEDQLTPYPLHSPAAASLLYGRLYLPQSLLEALVIRRVTPALQLQLSAVSGHFLRDGGTLLGLAQYDVGRYSLEGLASSDGGLLGLRGLYNFGNEVDDAGVVPSSPPAPPLPVVTGNGGADEARERIYGRFSAGGEIYYGTLNKSGGVSLGARFATLPAHRGTPLTATLTLNPLMGNVCATYALMAGRNCSLATKFDFNVFSYESDWAVGMELWRKRPPIPTAPVASVEKLVRERSFQAKLEWRLDDPEEVEKAVTSQKSEGAGTSDDEYTGVLKARLDQNLRIGLMWEGRAKSLLFSLGSGIDLRHSESPFRTLGLEVQFSS
ncbi:hypothetical protein SODALDRAFT_326203 [Sodiomyces alkalinus F11]|uniref:Mitochondrial distribution and morphology protein 10 n=1 Tax=Sodiomyces alkalinus (strain CBS 110278 / VKM F-3762 / F11) TaxID=1314773 RepID=A0A3N2Q5J6_SODAK|nr:hypothetical protein SODALDRAFT_326203 [Sodiomyces alkalinus F11]ROT42041.1 hypothetical protein SODALDRAFT_326203 [Sodiomyces alkalinus F11]